MGGREKGASIPRYYQVVAVTHAADSLDDFGLIVFDDFNTLQILPRASGLRPVITYVGSVDEVPHTIPKLKHHLANSCELVYLLHVS